MSQTFQFFSPEIDKFLNENIMRDFLVSDFWFGSITEKKIIKFATSVPETCEFPSEKI